MFPVSFTSKPDAYPEKLVLPTNEPPDRVTQGALTALAACSSDSDSEEDAFLTPRSPVSPIGTQSRLCNDSDEEEDLFLTPRSPLPSAPVEPPILEPICEIRETLHRPTAALPSTYIYAFTNEYGLEETRSFLMGCPLLKNGCHIGVSGLYNFDIIAQRKSACAFLFDINEKNRLFLQDTLNVLKRSANRFEFAANMRALHRLAEAELPDLFHHIQFSPRFEFELTREGSWLCSSESFHHIRKLALEDKICPVIQDIKNTETFEKTGKLLKTCNLQIDTLYTSNLCDYMKGYEEKFIESIKALLGKETILIHCPGRITEDRGRKTPSYATSLIQRACLGKDLQEKTDFFWIRSQKGDRTTIQKRKEFVQKWDAFFSAKCKMARFEQHDDAWRREQLKDLCFQLFPKKSYK